MQGNLNRVFPIVRTEQFSIFRETSGRLMEGTGFIKEWEWLTEPDTCDTCLEKNVKKYPIIEVFDTDPNCRCANLPVIK